MISQVHKKRCPFETYFDEHRYWSRGTRYRPQKSTNLICSTRLSKNTPKSIRIRQTEKKLYNFFPLQITSVLCVAVYVFNAIILNWKWGQKHIHTHAQANTDIENLSIYLCILDWHSDELYSNNHAMFLAHRAAQP